MPPHHSCFVDSDAWLPGSSSSPLEASRSPISSPNLAVGADRSRSHSRGTKWDSPVMQEVESQSNEAGWGQSSLEAMSSDSRRSTASRSRSTGRADSADIPIVRPPTPASPPSLSRQSVCQRPVEEIIPSSSDEETQRPSLPSHGKLHTATVATLSPSPSRRCTAPSPLPINAITSHPSLLSRLVSCLTCLACGHVLQEPTTLLCGHSVCLGCSEPTARLSRHPVADDGGDVNGQRGRQLTTPFRRGSFSINSASVVAQSPTSTFCLPGLFRRDRASPSPTPSFKSTTHLIRSKIACPNPTCLYQHVGAISNTGPSKVDFVLKSVLTHLRREVPNFDVISSDDENEIEEHAQSSEWRTATATESTTAGSDAASLSSSGGGDDPTGPDAKRTHKSQRRQPHNKRVRRRSRAVASDAEGISQALLADLQSELECQVCTQLFHDPVTSPCGHTFCHKCLKRSLDHSDKCPLCRSDFPSFSYVQRQPINVATRDLILIAFPTLAEERRAALEADERSSDHDVPIFVCTLAWPNLPTFLHIFEPRYRLMIRRVMDSNHQFGMVLPSRHSGGVHEYGTMLHVQSCNMIEDGRSIVETIGTYRFRVLETSTFDGYTVGRIQRVDDISPEVEAEQERLALASNPMGPRDRSSSSTLFATTGATPSSSASPSGLVQLPHQATAANIELSTKELVDICIEFVQVLRSGSAPWVLQRLNNTIGPMPTNPSDFSWWMGAIMPLDEHVKAALLQITSPRERLRLTVFWIERLRSSWWFSRGCDLM